MTTLGYQFVSICAGGGHVDIAVTFNGGGSRTISYLTDDLLAPLSDITVDDQNVLALLILKAHFAGSTRAQAKTALQAGVTVTL